jgi:fibronectin type 3 domain-containing protein
MAIAGFFQHNDRITEKKQAHRASNIETEKVTLTWDKVSNATSYNVYWSKSKGVNKRNGVKIPAVKNPVTINGLKRGATYYFVVTAVNKFGESRESDELPYTVGK